MKELKLKIPMDFSEAAIEQCIIDFTRECGNRAFYGVELVVSIFDANSAILMMIDDKMFCAVNKVTLTPLLRSGEFEITDTVNKLTIKSCS